MNKLQSGLMITIIISLLLVINIYASNLKEEYVMINPIETMMTTDTNNKVTEIETTTSNVAVNKIKVSYKKNMTVGQKQKVKIKILPSNATNKNYTILNKNNKVLKIKGNKIIAKKAGVGKLVIKALDENCKKIIKIKIKNKKIVTSATFQGIKLQYSATYNICSNPLTPSMGVKYYNGQKETYYSQNVLPGGGLSIPGRHVANDGTIRDKNGYIVVSANYSFKTKYSTFMTSLGPAKVYDTGCAYGVVDIYVNW